MVLLAPDCYIKWHNYRIQLWTALVLCDYATREIQRIESPEGRIIQELSFNRIIGVEAAPNSIFSYVPNCLLHVLLVDSSSVRFCCSLTYPIAYYYNCYVVVIVHHMWFSVGKLSESIVSSSNFTLNYVMIKRFFLLLIFIGLCL